MLRDAVLGALGERHPRERRADASTAKTTQLRDQNRRDIRKSQSMWTASQMESSGSQPPLFHRHAEPLPVLVHGQAAHCAVKQQPELVAFLHNHSAVASAPHTHGAGGRNAAAAAMCVCVDSDRLG